VKLQDKPMDEKGNLHQDDLMQNPSDEDGREKERSSPSEQ